MFLFEIQDVRYRGQLGNLFYPSSPEEKGQFTRNLVGNIGAPYGLKVTKIVPIENPRWPES